MINYKEDNNRLRSKIKVSRYILEGYDIRSIIFNSYLATTLQNN